MIIAFWPFSILSHLFKGIMPLAKNFAGKFDSLIFKKLIII